MEQMRPANPMGVDGPADAVIRWRKAGIAKARAAHQIFRRSPIAYNAARTTSPAKTARILPLEPAKGESTSRASSKPTVLVRSCPDEGQFHPFADMRVEDEIAGRQVAEARLLRNCVALRIVARGGDGSVLHKGSTHFGYLELIHKPCRIDELSVSV